VEGPEIDRYPALLWTGRDRPTRSPESWGKTRESYASRTGLSRPNCCQLSALRFPVFSGPSAAIPSRPGPPARAALPIRARPRRVTLRTN